MNEIILQMVAYVVVFFMALLLCAFLFRGFFFPFFRVRTSLGKFVLVKLRDVNRDFFKVGTIKDGFLLFKVSGKERRISIKDQAFLYRCLGVFWIDVDDAKNAIAKPNYSLVSGFDGEKYNDLYLRALYKPSIYSSKEIFILLGLLLVVVLVLVTLFVQYRQGQSIEQLGGLLRTVQQATIKTGGL